MYFGLISLRRINSLSKILITIFSNMLTWAPMCFCCSIESMLIKLTYFFSEFSINGWPIKLRIILSSGRMDCIFLLWYCWRHSWLRIFSRKVFVTLISFLWIVFVEREKCFCFKLHCLWEHHDVQRWNKLYPVRKYHNGQ